MTNHTDPSAGPSSQDGDLRTSTGEIVWRAGLERAAKDDPSVAGYEGVELAKAALHGDQAALDQFHGLTGLVLPGVAEHGEGDPVRLVMITIRKVVHGLEVRGASVYQSSGNDRAAFQATYECGYNCTLIDAGELVAWILSPEGRAALERRGIAMSTPVAPATTAKATLPEVLRKALSLVERGNVVIMRAGSDYQVRLSGPGLVRAEMRYIDNWQHIGASGWFQFEGFSVDAALADDWEIVNE